MNIVSYNPFKPTRVKSIDNMLDELVGTTFSDIFGGTFVSATPSVNIVESEKAYDIEVAAPGLSKEDFEISIDNDTLIISGKKEGLDEEIKEGKYTRREFNFQSFTRRFHLTDDLDRENIVAKYDNGILKIQLVKTEDTSPSSRTIEIG